MNDNSQTGSAIPLGLENIASIDFSSPLARSIAEAVASSTLDLEFDDEGAEFVAVSEKVAEFLATRSAGEVIVQPFSLDSPNGEGSTGDCALVAVSDDKPFLISSLINVFGTSTIKQMYYGVVKAQVHDATPIAATSVVFVKIEALSRKAEQEFDEKLKTIRKILSDIAVVVADRHAINEEMRNIVFAAEEEESRTFMEWIIADHFIMFGSLRIALEGAGADFATRLVKESEKLGLCRTDHQFFVGLEEGKPLPMQIAEACEREEQLFVLKANAISHIHRTVHFDVVGVKLYDAKDATKLTGIRLLFGLLTSGVYAENVANIPLIRRKYHALLDRFGFVDRTHNQRNLRAILNDYPKDDLFQIDMGTLENHVRSIISIRRRPRVGVLLRSNKVKSFYSALIYLPRHLFIPGLLDQIGVFLEQTLSGELRAMYTSSSDDHIASVQYILRSTAILPSSPNPRELEEQITQITRPWFDRIIALVEKSKRGHIIQHFDGAFAENYIVYTRTHGIHHAVEDIDSIERMLAAGKDKEFAIRPPETRAGGGTDLRTLSIYSHNCREAISDTAPMLESLGMRVIEEVSFEITPDFENEAADEKSYIQLSKWLVAHPSFAKEESQENIFANSAIAALQAMSEGRLSIGGHNKLIMDAGLPPRTINLLRAYAAYLRQGGIAWTIQLTVGALGKWHEVTSKLVQLFQLRFDMAHGASEAEREATSNALVENILADLDAIPIPQEDTILRTYLNVILATSRTNFYVDQTGNDVIAFKLVPRELDFLPMPKPLHEIFVFSDTFEAVHLRFGAVARGGLRWSDRPGDFRTEVLGLVKAQQVKNSVIVPDGAKGGFVLKAPPADRAEFMREGIATYRTFISTMLDITDSLDGTEVVPPKGVMRRDGNDPYLVVAADKGTASFSDYANEVAINKGFWLGDAFASGGSVGYDHKKMGITARGAWESVKNHFSGLGIDTQSESITVVGVGDMSGDVFGNGMLLSPHIKLLAAFNHLSIFIDPTPNVARSFAERKRLFDEVKNWEHYDQSLLSDGGAIYPRSSKTITLTPQIQKWLQLDSPTTTPKDLIRTLLKAHFDLLWLGGIGTYVKSPTESHAAAGDRANDDIRVDATELNCRVLGEGANLGVTHRARIAFAEHGGAVNTDAIDNSAGVDCSDHEVNIKILLSDAIARGDLQIERRNPLLAEMTDEVAELVLENNIKQNVAINQIEAHAYAWADMHRNQMRQFERAGILDRALEFLPTDDELDARVAAKQGLTRPEIAVLLAYAKNFVGRQLLDSSILDGTEFEELLFAYFPKQLRDEFPESVKNHKLRREIIATLMANEVINVMGTGYVINMQDRTDATAESIVRAFYATSDIFDMETQRQELANCAMSRRTRILAMNEVWLTINRISEWMLLNHTTGEEMVAAQQHYRDTVIEVSPKLAGWLPQYHQDELATRMQRYQDVPIELRNSLAMLKLISTVPQTAMIAKQTQVDIETAMTTYLKVGESFGIDKVRTAINALSPATLWQKRAVELGIRNLWMEQANLTAHFCENGVRDFSSIFANRSLANRMLPLRALIDNTIETKEIDLAFLNLYLSALKGMRD